MRFGGGAACRLESEALKLTETPWGTCRLPVQEDARRQVAEAVVRDQWLLPHLLQGRPSLVLLYDMSEYGVTEWGIGSSQKQGQKLLAALNLPQVGAITLLAEDAGGEAVVQEFFCFDY